MKKFGKFTYKVIHKNETKKTTKTLFKYDDLNLRFGLLPSNKSFNGLLKEKSFFSNAWQQRDVGITTLSNHVYGHVDLTVLSIFQKAVTFDHNVTH